MIAVLWCFLVTTINLSSGRSYAVSSAACQNMTPIHGVEPQISIANVQVVPHAMRLKRGQEVKVTLRAISKGYAFRGFLVQARDVSTNNILGNFLSGGDEMKVMVCGDSYSTASHSNPSQKSTQVLRWKAPSDFRGFVRF